MKNINFIILALTITLGIACKKQTIEVPNPCANDKNFCLKIDAEQFVENAAFSTVYDPTHYRVYWADTSSSFAHSIELKVFTQSLKPGAYTMVDNPTTGKAQMKYTVDTIVYKSTDGILRINSVSETEITGTFSGTIASEGGVSKIVTEGNFHKVGN